MKMLIVASKMSHIKSFHIPYIEEMKRAGHQVFTMANGEEADFNIPFKKRTLSLKNFILSYKIKKIIKQEKFDVIYLHTTLAAFFVRLALRGMKQRPRVINTVHGYLIGNEFGKIHNKLYLLCEKLLKKQTDYILVMNEDDYTLASENDLSLDGVSKINGMGVMFKQGKSVTPKHNDKINMVFVGELSKGKNQEFLIKSLKRLDEKYTLTLLGEGKERRHLEALIKKEGLEDRVELVGFTPLVAEYLEGADIYVCASLKEGLPFNIIEAMEKNLPIVATNIRGQRDLLPDECLYEANDMEAFIKLVENAYNQKREYDYQKYSFESVFSENMRLYNMYNEEKIKIKS